MKVGGKERKVKFGLNQSILYCELRKINITKMNEEYNSLSTGDFNGSEFRDLLWSALKDGARINKEAFEDDNLTVGDWLEELTSEDIVSLMGELTGSMTVLKKKKK